MSSGHARLPIGLAPQLGGIEQRDAPLAVRDLSRLAQVAQALVDALAAGADQGREVVLAERKVDQDFAVRLAAEVLRQLEEDETDARAQIAQGETLDAALSPP